MKITDIFVDAVDVNGQHHWVFVRVATDEGIVGIGELNPSADRKAVLDALRRLKQEVVGEDPRRIETLTHRLLPSGEDRPGVHAFSGIEQALWDILGKSLNTPVYQLLGGACRDKIRLYANITRATLKGEPGEFARHAEGAVRDGLTAVKLAPFDSRRGRGRLMIDHGVRCVRAVRDAIGPEIDLLLDCYGIFSLKEARYILEGIQDIDLFWLEEPVYEDDVEGYLTLKEETGRQIAGGERMMCRAGFQTALSTQMMHVVMPDVTIVGGIGELNKVAAMAAARGIKTAPHGPFGPVTLAAHVQAMAVHPDFLILEYAWGQVPWRADLISPSETIKDGCIPLPDGPGLGISLNPDLLNKHRVEMSL